MFAVMKTGGKQYKVQAGDRLRVEKLAADAGETVQFNDILMLGGDAPVVGSPLVSGRRRAGADRRPGEGREAHPLRQAPPQARRRSARRATASS
jgi:ribosomal protein L21